MKQEVSEELLIRYILKEATAGEEQAVNNWIAQNEANARQLEGMKMIFESGKRLTPVSPLTETQAWDKFKQLRTERQPEDAKVRKMYPAASWLRIAAAVTIFAGAGWLISYVLKTSTDNAGNTVSIRTANNVKTVTLPDGSVIYINKNSVLIYAADFGSHRAVTLTGEAFFEVKHNEQAPFTVTTNGILIKDIGTTFNINGTHHRTEIVVESGIVQVSHTSGAVKLNANEMVVIKPGDKQLSVQKSTDMLYNYYRTNQFVAVNTPLWRLIEVVNEAYGSNIIIANQSLLNEPITVTIKREDSLATILNVIKDTTPSLHIVQTGNGFSIQ
ncbi:FecR domain-containing protein [Mucilaginibacter dorajii]|uniref:FecR domain-containing protein n=1 Tax=Mucilaginibacter dorajii TaxID=692994 RepID=A0ABP7PKQ6_9SPHI|nr:FecR domain-containing protein [Mucilaginibacter dorajii]MCS3733607.1 ferric-dicitrate binding protein FerR (iron transport regulator) [Mucilaginibacter dorajii]